MSVAVKICGVRTPEAAIAAVTAGADLIGLMFAPSKRQIDVATARCVVDAVRATAEGQLVTVVGVFVDETPTQMAYIATRVGLDWLQLSGHEPIETADALGVPVVKAVRYDGHPSEQGWLREPVACDMLPILLDAHVPGSFGGAGIVGDWAAARRLAATRPVLLAGGLDTSNVAQAIADVHPWGVDVSSGVETDGVKDLNKIRMFVEAAKSAS